MKKFKEVLKSNIEAEKRQLELALRQVPWMVTQLKKVAEDLRQESLKEKDEDLKKVYADDSHDMLQLAKALEDENYQLAVDKLFELNTAPHENIPTAVYNGIVKIYHLMGLR